MIYLWQYSVWHSVQQALQADHLPHALLFTGEMGCGNETFLQSLAQSFLCLKPNPDGFACGHCRSCQVYKAQSHPDFMAIGLQDERQAIVIEQIRELSYFLNLSRSYSPRRVVTLYPAERMNNNAANSLLKSLEEPSANTHLLLLSANPASLLPTIRSRCQVVRLPLPSTAQALSFLQSQQLTQPLAELLALAHGQPLTALALAKGESLTKRQQWLMHLQQIAQGQGNIVEISAYWEKYDKTLLLDWQLDYLLSQLKQAYQQATPLSGEILHPLRNPPKIWRIYEDLLELKKRVNHPLNPRAFVEAQLMAWAA
jgi:DNA polymerase-3 subunit delta'